MTKDTQSNNQLVLYDAVHGTLNLHMLNDADNEVLFKLLNNPYLNRLRNIKQLGFASHSHPSADHSRYAHAIGTMYVMNLLYHKVKNTHEFKQIIKDVQICLSGDLGTYEIQKHLLLAGLLQDIGELPYAEATKGLIRPDNHLIKTVTDKIGESDTKLQDKDIFTIGAIFSKDLENELVNLNISFEFLIYLITGHEKENKKNKMQAGRALLHMVDGAVDADRLDYIYRDAHHTYGHTGGPNQVISSLLFYDKDGPVFNNSGPVSEYFLKRGHLWTNVYLEPGNRFKNVLLKTFIDEYFKVSSKSAKKNLASQISLDQFKKFDDITLFYELNNINRKITDIGISTKGKISIKNILNPEENYQWYWLPPISADAKKDNNNLPSEIFYDTFLNYRDSKLFKTKTIRIKDPRYLKVGEPLYLENCSGAFVTLSSEGWKTLPIANSILVFKPEAYGNGDDWSNFRESFENGSLYSLIENIESEGLGDISNKTWDDDGFNEPRIFISYAFTDKMVVNKIVKNLYDKKRKYYFIREGGGDGAAPKENGRNGINEADVVILIASTNYVDGFNKGQNVQDEVLEMITKNIKPYILGIDEYNKLETLPWRRLGHDGVPTAYNLRVKSYVDIEPHVRSVLELIDKKGQNV